MDLFETIHNHRSIRKYTDEPISHDKMNKILEAGLRASSYGNMNTYSIVVTQDPDIRDQMYIPHIHQSMVRECQALITFCADFNRTRHWLRLNDAPDGFDNFSSFMIAAIDAILVSQNVALAAEAEGLGICYLGSTFTSADQIGKVLKLPPGVMPVVGFTIGHPAEDPEPRDRLPLAGVVHYDTYQPYTDEKIKETFAYREDYGWKRYMGNKRLREKVEKAGADNLAKIYSIIKYPRKRNQKYSQMMFEYLEKQDFMNN